LYDLLPGHSLCEVAEIDVGNGRGWRAPKALSLENHKLLPMELHKQTITCKLPLSLEIKGSLSWICKIPQCGSDEFMTRFCATGSPMWAADGQPSHCVAFQSITHVERRLRLKCISTNCHVFESSCEL
jgi:hypothetical protein